MTVAQKLEPSDLVMEDLNERGKAINGMESKEREKRILLLHPHFLAQNGNGCHLDFAFHVPSLCLFITQSPPNGQKDPSGPKTLLPFPLSGVSRVREPGSEPCCSLGLSDLIYKMGAVTNEIASGTE